MVYKFVCFIANLPWSLDLFYRQLVMVFRFVLWSTCHGLQINWLFIVNLPRFIDLFYRQPFLHLGYASRLFSGLGRVVVG